MAGWKGSGTDMVSSLKRLIPPIVDNNIRVPKPDHMPDETWAKVVEKRVEKALLGTLVGVYVYQGNTVGKIPAHKRKTMVKRAMDSFGFDFMKTQAPPGYDSD